MVIELEQIMDAVEDLIKDQLNLGKEDLTELSVQNAYEDSTTETPITCIFKGVVTPLDEVYTQKRIYYIINFMQRWL